MDLNEFSKEITLEEGLKKSISIAQVEEVIRILGDRWETMSPEMVIEEVEMITRGGV